MGPALGQRLEHHGVLQRQRADSGIEPGAPLPVDHGLCRQSTFIIKTPPAVSMIKKAT
jgi:ribosomal protein L11